MYRQGCARAILVDSIVLKADDMLERRDVRRNLDELAKLHSIRAQDRLHLGVVEDVLDLFRSKDGEDRNADDTRADAREIGDDELETILGHDADAIAVSDAERAQRERERLDLL